MPVERICILGGTGFVGRHIANRLAGTPTQLRVLTRRRERNRHLLPIPNLELVEANPHDEETLTAQFAGCDAVINLVGVLHDSGTSGSGFEAAHIGLPDRVIRACRHAGVPRLLHMSALGADDDAPSRYQQSKAAGERAVLTADGADLRTTVFRPSVIFGPGDSFLNRFAALLRISPVLLLPTPQARFQPVYVGDVADAFVTSLEDRATFGQRYPLCGPTVYTLRELVTYCGQLMELRRLIIGLDDRRSRLAARVLQRLPGTPYSYDNYLASRTDNICTRSGLSELGIYPTALEAVAPAYLTRRHGRNRYNEFRRMARRE